MHKIFIDEGSFNFIYQMPQILYSAIILNSIILLIKFLSLSEQNILKIKKIDNKENFNKEIYKIIHNLKIKFIIFFILNFVFLLFFWFYLGCFCAVYKNTQIYLIKDTLISFLLTLLYPIFLNLIPGMFRIYALNSNNKDKDCIYKISKIIQIF